MPVSDSFDEDFPSCVFLFVMPSALCASWRDVSSLSRSASSVNSEADSMLYLRPCSSDDIASEASGQLCLSSSHASSQPLKGL